MAYDIKEMEQYIRNAARQRGIDPDVAVRVARSEGLARGTWQSNIKHPTRGREPSYGPFQLLEGGRGGWPTGMGNDFRRVTGLDPSDPKNAFASVDFALDQAAKGGWGPWYGARHAGIGNWQGIGPNAAARGITLNSNAPQGVQQLAAAGREQAPPLSPPREIADRPIPEMVGQGGIGAATPGLEFPKAPTLFDAFKNHGFTEGMKNLSTAMGAGGPMQGAMGLLAGAFGGGQQEQVEDITPAVALQGAEQADAGRMAAAQQLMSTMMSGRPRRRLGGTPGISLMG